MTSIHENPSACVVSDIDAHLQPYFDTHVRYVHTRLQPDVSAAKIKELLQMNIELIAKELPVQLWEISYMEELAEVTCCDSATASHSPL